MRYRPFRALAFGCLASLCLAAPAMADTIRYDIPASPNYTVDNEQGIAKVTFNTCLVVNQPTSISFNVVTETTKEGMATYTVMKEPNETGIAPPAVFDPATVALTAGQQTIATTLTFTPAEISSSGVLLRAKLDPESGAGIGQGPGFLVKINCVEAAAPPAQQPVPPAQQPTPAAPAGSDAQGRPNPFTGFGPTLTPVPIVAVPSAAAGAAAGPARCITVDRVKVRAGIRTRIVVRVRTAAGKPVNKAYVRIRGLGISQAKLTNADGRVIFSVKARRKGTLFVQSNTCVGADRVAVLGAATSPNVNGVGRPSYTG